MLSESLNATLNSFNNNTYIELADQIAECYSLAICPINIFLIVIMFPLFIIEGKRYHRNYCMLRIHVLIAFASLSIGFPSSALLSFIEGNLIPIENFELFDKFTKLFIFGQELLRFLWIALCIERAIATIYSENYEIRTFGSLPIFLTLFCYTTAVIIVLCKMVWRINSEYIFTITFLIDVMGVVSMVFLFNYNRKRLKHGLEKDLQLSEKYQLNENVRSLKTLFPLLVTGLCFTISASIIRLLSLKIDFFNQFYKHSILFYYSLFCTYILIANIIWIRTIVSKMQFWKRIWHSRRINQLDQNYVTERVNINRASSMQEYFVVLERCWKN